MTTTSLRDAIRSAASTPLRPETRARLAAAPGVLARAASTALESGSRDGLYEVMCQAFDVPALSPAARCWLEETLEIESFDGPLELFGVARMLLDGPRR